METTYDRLVKIYANCGGHMTKMANAPIYGKKEGWWPWDLVLSIQLGMLALPSLHKWISWIGPWPTLRQGHIWYLMHLYRKNLEMFIFQLFKPNSEYSERKV